MAYVGHPGGMDEYRGVMDAAQGLCAAGSEDGSQFRMYAFDPHDEGRGPESCPKLVIIRKSDPSRT